MAFSEFDDAELALMMTQQGLAFVNGKISRLDEATVPLTDRGFLFGHAIFETILVLDGKMVGLQEHLKRLSLGCKQALIRSPGETQIVDWCELLISEFVQRAGAMPAKLSVRIVLTGGSSANLNIDRLPTGELPHANVAIFCRPVSPVQKDFFEKGLSLKSVRDVRPQEFLSLKSCNYLWNLLALEQAKADGFDDALFVNSKNQYTEATTANLVWFNKAGELFTIAPAGNALPGTTLMLLERALKKQGKQVQRSILEKDEFKDVSGLAVLSSVRGFVPVNRIDGTHFEIKPQLPLLEQFQRLLQQEQILSANAQ